MLNKKSIILFNYELGDQLKDTARASQHRASSWLTVEYVELSQILFLKRSRVATHVSAYAEDSSTELTDERRLPLIVQSLKNLQKKRTRRTTSCERPMGERREDSQETNWDKTLSLRTRHRPCTPPIHLRRAYIFGRLVFPPREIYHVSTPLLSRALPSVLDVWQGIIGRVEEWPETVLQKLLWR